LALVIATVFLIAMMGSASALYPCPAPGNIEISSSCELTHDYTVSAGQYGYRITADNVVIDGKGYTITGTVSRDDCLCNIDGGDAGESHPANHAGIHIISRTNVAVKDLKVTKFCTGIVLKRSVDCIITGCLIDDHDRSDQAPTHVSMWSVQTTAT
jgi:hypothetical protein